MLCSLFLDNWRQIGTIDFVKIMTKLIGFKGVEKKSKACFKSIIIYWWATSRGCMTFKCTKMILLFFIQIIWFRIKYKINKCFSDKIMTLVILNRNWTKLIIGLEIFVSLLVTPSRYLKLSTLLKARVDNFLYLNTQNFLHTLDYSPFMALSFAQKVVIRISKG